MLIHEACLHIKAAIQLWAEMRLMWVFEGDSVQVVILLHHNITDAHSVLNKVEVGRSPSIKSDQQIAQPRRTSLFFSGWMSFSHHRTANWARVLIIQFMQPKLLLIC